MKLSINNLFSENSISKTLLLSTFIAYAITIICFIFYAILLTYSQITENYLSLIVTIITVLSVFISGFETAKKVNNKGLFWGGLAGLIYASLLLIVGYSFSDSFTIDLKSFFLVLLMLLSGSVGGIFGINLKK